MSSFKRGAKEAQESFPFTTPEAVSNSASDEISDTITISRHEYDDLLADRALLDALRQAGVDNWSGYSEAMSIFEAA
jgi:methylmalonyl-CoA mutase cobalamin-binding subunit